MLAGGRLRAGLIFVCYCFVEDRDLHVHQQVRSQEDEHNEADAFVWHWRLLSMN